MRIIEETADYLIYLNHFQGIPVHFFKNKISGEILINCEDMAKCLGFDSLNEMMLSRPDMADIYLDSMNNGSVVNCPF